MCDTLLTVYERSVRRYTSAALNMVGIPGTDFSVVFAETKRLRNAAGKQTSDSWRIGAPCIPKSRPTIKPNGFSKTRHTGRPITALAC